LMLSDNLHREEHCLFLRYLIYFFFFSSRRRHTRSKRDWSSDVCSSDLKDKLLSLRLPVLIIIAKSSRFVKLSAPYIFSRSRGLSEAIISFIINSFIKILQNK